MRETDIGYHKDARGSRLNKAYRRLAPTNSGDLGVDDVVASVRDVLAYLARVPALAITVPARVPEEVGTNGRSRVREGASVRNEPSRCEH